MSHVTSLRDIILFSLFLVYEGISSLARVANRLGPQDSSNNSKSYSSKFPYPQIPQYYIPLPGLPSASYGRPSLLLGYSIT